MPEDVVDDVPGMADRVSDDRAPGRAPSGPFDDRWPSTARTSAAPPSPRSAVGSRVREPGPSPVAQTRPGITPSPPDVVPQNGRRAARAPRAGAHPERRHAHARSGGTVAAARTPEGPIARLVLLAGVIWRDRSARAELRRRLVGQPRGWTHRSWPPSSPKTTVVHPDEDPGDHGSGARRDSHLSTTCPGITARALESALLDRAWIQWIALGVDALGESDDAVVDPEALIALTAELGDAHARLRDVSTDWCVADGRYVNGARLKQVMRELGTRLADGDAAATRLATSPRPSGRRAVPETEGPVRTGAGPAFGRVGVGCGGRAAQAAQRAGSPTPRRHPRGPPGADLRHGALKLNVHGPVSRT